MAKPSKELIAELQRTKRFMGTCPACSEEFRLADAALFSIDDAPPEAALAAIEAGRQGIRERRDELARAKVRMTAKNIWLPRPICTMDCTQNSLTNNKWRKIKYLMLVMAEGEQLRSNLLHVLQSSLRGLRGLGGSFGNGAPPGDGCRKPYRRSRIHTARITCI